MRHITDAMIDDAITFSDAHRVLRDAFADFGHDRAAMQARIRTEAGGVKLSTLGAVIPGQGVCGAKVYTTIQGRFTFVILLFATDDGRPLATFDAAAITRLRTAACSIIAAESLARPDARSLALFGAGVQGRMHAIQMAARFGLTSIRYVDPYAPPGLAAELSAACGCEVRATSVDDALDGADLVVTASRSTTPLFTGDRLPAGCFVAAIGSSLPHTRELDDRALARASTIAVEWKPQSLREAGDLVLADPKVLDADRIVELAELVTGDRPGRSRDDEITLYKSVGVGLEDIALAGLAWQRITG